ncbi:hypothetical protein [Ulvibacter litoralis]|uniref:Phytanoyl-CoA dioxygenase n=1 Tax=Ulvibacter litoralis TaxID=227084 RepID=A0A1G7IVM0_9FLAO|nr:hypothetical protein [Ulvibacter litoralis]GHC63409.1 hypothetical protein GCM10008083_30890 [Ulvibacter litoralis]SDF16703.1 hypothetical protein SAMN05421855_10742 [Ulvibacter litoralis]
MNAQLKKIDDIASVLYADTMHYGKLLEACKNLSLLLNGITAPSFSSLDEDTAAYTSSGKAISFKWAGMCIDDIIRTKKFSHGLYKAVKKVQETKNGKVHIVYAGTGPFATLTIPLLSKFTASEITFTLLEINSDSFENLKKVISYFSAEAYVSVLEQCDAARYKLKTPEEVDIIISETMMAGLKTEPQVAITYNLMRQVPDTTLLIPEEITLNIIAVNKKQRSLNKQSIDTRIPYYTTLASVFTVSKSTVRAHQDAFIEAFPKYQFPENTLEIPNDIQRGYDQLNIETVIKIFDDEVLEIDESGLTVLLPLLELNPMLETISSMETQYVCGENPGLICRPKM